MFQDSVLTALFVPLDKMTPYAGRRRVANAGLDKEQRSGLLAHAPDSSMHQRAYQSTTSFVDLQSLAQGREQNQAVIDLIRVRETTVNPRRGH